MAAVEFTATSFITEQGQIKFAASMVGVTVSFEPMLELESE